MNEDQHELLYLALRKLIPPPNPIIDKTFPEQVTPTREVPPLLLPFQGSSQEEEASQGPCLLANVYSKKSLVFDKWPWRQNTRNNVTYFASAFLQRGTPLPYVGQRSAEGLQFGSDFEGGNLLAAYRVSEQEYDLLLQNDLNSGGYTQWFDFTVGNGTTRGTVKLNIVNFYKKRSLFGQGLRPLTRSLVFQKGWRRGCHAVQYFVGDVPMEGRKGKHYRVLSFKYDFIFENDCVRFCYCLPYTYTDLHEFVSRSACGKVLRGVYSQLRVKYLGATPLGKIISVLQVSAENERSRRAVVLLGRQHAGETPSSHVLQAVIEELLAASQQSQFLLSRFNFYVFPMVNVDGVVIGNYRCNFHGFDLNRSWHLDESKKHPEIAAIKAQIKRIMRREEIALIIDFHGHSAKMNSFFYGNSFGKHNMLLPCVAARMEPFIDFADCTFSDDEEDKANTARVVLGNMIKETGSAYTFEISLFGGIRNGKRVPFGGEHYQGIAKSLMLALYKTEMELHKEEKLLKESLYLRDIRKEIKRFQCKPTRNDPGSDEEAKRTSLIEEKIKISPQKIVKKPSQGKEKRQRWELLTMEQQTQTEGEFNVEQYKQIKGPIQEREKRVPAEERKKKLSFSIRKVAVGEQSSRKNQLMSKLRIFGETFAQEAPFLDFSTRLPPSCAEAQTDLTFFKEKRTPMPMIGLEREGNRSSYITASFLGRRLGEPNARRQERIYKSSSTRVTQAEVSFGDLIRHNKLSLV